MLDKKAVVIRRPCKLCKKSRLRKNCTVSGIADNAFILLLRFSRIVVSVK